MKTFVLLAAILGAASAVSFFEVVVEEWAAWKFTHGKNYTSDMEEKFRMKIFMENKARIAKHNSDYAQGRKTYSLKMNHFGDMLPHEFRSVMNGYDHQAKLKMLASGAPQESATYIQAANVKMPTQVDWRDSGAVTPVKNQGQCGSCWAFSTTGALEGQHFRKTGKLVSLSEQNLVDCSKGFGNNGCDGGLMDNAFKYIKSNHGIDTEESYPYEGRDDKCHYKPRDKGATDIGFVDIPSGDEKKMAAALATVGPLSIAIDASQESFQFYSEGVYSDDGCQPDNLDHGVLAVGYGTENGQDYFLVKNSWGEGWGQKGYIKMARNMNNMCGVATQASYPLV